MTTKLTTYGANTTGELDFQVNTKWLHEFIESEWKVDDLDAFLEECTFDDTTTILESAQQDGESELEIIKMIELKEVLKEYLDGNHSEIKSIVSECNSWDNSLEEYELYENDEDFFETFFSGKPMEAVRATQFGTYDYSDEYVKFNGYGNLDSYSEYGYHEMLNNGLDYIIETAIELHDNNSISLDNEIESIIEQYNELESFIIQ